MWPVKCDKCNANLDIISPYPVAFSRKTRNLAIRYRETSSQYDKNFTYLAGPRRAKKHPKSAFVFCPCCRVVKYNFDCDERQISIIPGSYSTLIV